MARCAVLAAIAFAVGTAHAQSTLPPIPAPGEFERALAESRVAVKKITVEGVKAISPDEIRAIVAAYEGRNLSEGDLREIERRLTQLYLDRGYATSGVLLKRRPGPEGEAIFAAVEGTIAQVRFKEPPQYASPAWLTSLLIPDPDTPIRLEDLQERMTALRESGVVERINAEVQALAALGSAELVVSVEERRPWDLEVHYDNYHSPVIGARRPSLWFTHRNPTGWGDKFDAHIGKTEGLDDWHVEYGVPWPRTGWRFGARIERSDSLALEPAAFRELEIRAVSETRRAEVAYAWIQKATRSFSTSLAFERREADSHLLGAPFSFVAGIPDGLTGVDVWRAAAEYTASSADAVVFLRGQWSFGDSTREILPVEGAPERRFQSLGFQAQYARRIGEGGAQVLVRVDGQYSPDTLVPIEKKAIGGAQTVRGFRENLLLRDSAVSATIEGRWPAWRYGETIRLTLAAFIDAGYARDALSHADALPRSIASAGMGLIVNLPYGLSARVDYAVPNHRWLTENSDSQDRGVHFQVVWNASALLP